MSSVVSFLNMLERDAAEANGNVKRMLSVCAEFERIARVVLDKAEREIRGRGKRKAPITSEGPGGTKVRKDNAQGIKDSIGEALDEGKTLEQMQVETQAAYRRPVQTPSLRASQAGSQAGASPASWGQSPPGGTGPEYANAPGAAAGDPMNGTPWMSNFNRGNNGGDWANNLRPPGQQPDFPPASGPSNQNHYNTNGQNGLPPVADFNNFPIDPNLDPNGFNGMDGMNNNGGNNGLGGPFQQPFVPQDLWQMPMTLEWDWAEGLGLGSFTPGPMFDGTEGYNFDGSRMDGLQGQGHGQ